MSSVIHGTFTGIENNSDNNTNFWQPTIIIFMRSQSDNQNNSWKKR